MNVIISTKRIISTCNVYFQQCIEPGMAEGQAQVLIRTYTLMRISYADAKAEQSNCRTGPISVVQQLREYIKETHVPVKIPLEINAIQNKLSILV